jgi:hypothetical protein
MGFTKSGAGRARTPGGGNCTAAMSAGPKYNDCSRFSRAHLLRETIFACDLLRRYISALWREVPAIVLSQREMTVPFRTISALLVAASFLWTAVLTELAHQDLPEGVSLSCPVLMQHACGSHERHIPLDDLQQCNVCAQGSQRHSTPPVPLLPERYSTVSPAASPILTDRLVSIAYLFSGKRGPPASFA